MVTTLENRSGGVGGGKFAPCPGPGCKTKIKNTALCTECIDKLPRTLRVQLEAALDSEPDDSFDMLITACLDELRNQAVEQVRPGSTRRRKAR